MKCPFCSHPESKVVDSRPDKGGSSIRRRRECEDCGKRFTSHERVEEILPLVLKKDGRREPFDRMKLIAGIKKACEKRPISVETVERMVDGLEARMQEGERKGDPQHHHWRMGNGRASRYR
jgi:transcriptional repressor NrdR